MSLAPRRMLSYALAVAGNGILVAAAPLFDLGISRAGYTVQRDLAYGSNPRQRLDLYVPASTKRSAPVLLYFYGGSWQSGSKAIYRVVGQAFASAGIITAIADYRLYPEIKYPAFVEDGARAAQFLGEHVSEYGGDAERLFLSGHSAGAYIAAMLACNPAYGVPKARGVIGIAGPYDFLPLRDPVMIDIFGGERVAATQPIVYAHNQTPPMLLVHGTADHTVGAGNSRRMAKRLAEAGNDVELIQYQGVSHLGIVISLAHGFRRLAPLRADMLRFIAKHPSTSSG